MPMSFGGVSKVKVATIIVAADGSGDTTDIQTGINLLPAGGGSVWVKEGTYTLTSKVNLDRNNVGLIGSGNATILDCSGTAGIDIYDITNCSIENFTFTGNVDDAFITGTMGSPKQIRVRGCYFHDGTGGGLRFTTGQYHIAENYFEAVGGGVGFPSSINLNTGKSVISGNMIVDSGFAGIVLASGSSRSVVANNVIVNADNQGIQVQSADTLVEGNVLDGNSARGIVLMNADRSLIKGNICKNNAESGVEVYSSNDVVVEGNVCIGNDSEDTTSWDGINLNSDCNNCIIAGNRCSENDNYEINIEDADCDKNLIHGNHCIGTDHEGAINDSGTNTTQTDNVTV